MIGEEGIRVKNRLSLFFDSSDRSPVPLRSLLLASDDLHLLRSGRHLLLGRVFRDPSCRIAT